jgi:hypothetical protein
MIMSVSDGGSPFAAQQNAGPTSPPSGTWTVTVRNTGTAASSGTTQIQLSMDYNSSHLQPASGSGWSCDTTSYGATCTNTAAVPAGGSLPRSRDQGAPAFANPRSGQYPWTGQGRIDSTSSWTVTLPADSQLAPSKANLPAQTDPPYRSQNIVSQFFGLGPDSSVVQMTAGIWTYYGVPGAPGGVMQQIYP